MFLLLLARSLVPGPSLPPVRPLSILRAIDRIPERNDETEIYVYAFACAPFTAAAAAAAAAATAVAKQRRTLDSAAPREVLKSHNCDIYIRATLTTRDRPPTGDTARILSGRANERTNERMCERTFAYLRGDYAIECYTRL